jgi:hypothetical protein
MIFICAIYKAFTPFILRTPKPANKSLLSSYCIDKETEIQERYPVLT